MIPVQPNVTTEISHNENSSVKKNTDSNLFYFYLHMSFPVSWDWADGEWMQLGSMSKQSEFTKAQRTSINEKWYH